MHGSPIVRRFFNSDMGAWVTPCALVAGLLIAVFGLSGCAEFRKLAGPDNTSWLEDKERTRGGAE